jgi:hypothetical protein
MEITHPAFQVKLLALIGRELKSVEVSILSNRQ